MSIRSVRRGFAALVLALSVVFVGGVFATAQHAHAAEPAMTVYKSPWCGCCAKWVEHMRRHGFAVKVVEMEDLEPAKRMFGVAPDLASCHTAGVGGYVIEGHVPAADVKRLLAEKPAARGLAVPGMPVGSPGMEQGGRKDAYEVILFTGEDREVYARY